MKTILILLLGLVAGLTGCATPYQAMNWDGGYQQRQIADDQYVVGFRGNSFTHYQDVKDFALLRAADIGLFPSGGSRVGRALQPRMAAHA
jgi:hypothetical protein